MRETMVLDSVHRMTDKEVGDNNHPMTELKEVVDNNHQMMELKEVVVRTDSDMDYSSFFFSYSAS
jgi:hypothetical protein